MKYCNKPIPSLRFIGLKLTVSSLDRICILHTSNWVETGVFREACIMECVS
ncbi:MAG: hypothetical protein QXI36_07625 [Candidatus Bathyarchaeia archaeon]